MPQLTPDDQRALFALVRETIRARLEDRELPALPGGGSVLAEPRGVFVTLWRRGDLRGCIGHTIPHLPLAEAVRALAQSAAFDDHRFDPVTFEELDELAVDLSVLSPLERADVTHIEVGVHGLFVRRGGRSGILLPQVASERAWSPRTFLEHTCQKAGLPSDAWQRGDTEVLWFTAEVFEDPPPSH